MSDFDTECARCHGKGLAASQTQAAVTPPPQQPVSPQQPPQPYPGQYPVGQPGTAPDDAPSFPMAALGFCIPLVGLIMFLVDRNTRPQRARSSGLGALVGVASSFLFFILLAGSAVVPVVGRAADNAQRSACQSNLKRLSLAAFQYSVKNNDTYPDLSSPAAIKTALSSYTTTPEIFACSKGQEYLGNPAISRQSLAALENPAMTIMFYDAQDSHLGGRNVAYADGHVRYLDKQEWENEKLKQRLP